MHQEVTNLRSEFATLSWKVAAVFIGGSLPLILFGKAILATWFSIGLIFGGIAMLEDRPTLKDLREIFLSRVSAITVIMLLIFASSALNSVEQHYSLVRFYEMFYLSVASGVLVLVLKKMPREFVYLVLKVLSLTTLLITLLILMDSFFDIERLRYALHGKRWDHIDRLEQMGSVIAILSPFVWAWLFKLARKDNHYWAKRIGLPISYLLFFTVIVCGGVAGWVSCFVGVVVYLIMGGKWHGLAISSKHWVLMPCAVFVAFLAYITASGAIHLQDHKFVGQYSEYFSFVGSSIEYLENTPVLGIGVNATRFLPTPDAIIGKSASQNFILQLLVETGFLGFGAAALLIGLVMYKLYQYARVDTYGLAGISSMIVFFTASLSNTSIFNAWWLAFFIALSSLSVRLCKG